MENILAYPNPASGNQPLSIRFETRFTPSGGKIAVFTAALRKIREFDIGPDLQKGINIYELEEASIFGLANGTYYYIMILWDKEGRPVKSKAEKFIKIR